MKNKSLSTFALILVFTIVINSCQNDIQNVSKVDSSNLKNKTDTSIIQNNDLYNQWNTYIEINKDKSNKFAQLADDDTEIPIARSEIKTEMEKCFDGFISFANSQCRLTTGSVPPSGQPKVTEAIYFGSVDLQKWLTNNKVFANSNNIELRLGVYTKKFLDSLGDNDASKIGRLTIFIVPRKANGDYATDPQGKLIPAFNLGGLKP